MTLEKFFAVVHPSDRTKCRKLFDEAVDPDKGGKCRTEVRIVQSSGHSVRWIAALGQTQFDDGSAKRIVGIARVIYRTALTSGRTTRQPARQLRVPGRRNERGVSPPTVNADIAGRDRPATAVWS